MSLAILKKKSNMYKSVISGKGKNGFSINGGMRNQGWVGQDTLGRHLNGTPFRGLEPMGNGGKGGKYVKSIVNSGSCYTNDPDVIKRSTLNTSGYLNATVKHPTAVYNEGCSEICSVNWVKNFNSLDHSQSSYIEKVKLEKTKCKEISLIEDIINGKNKDQDAVVKHKDEEERNKEKCGCKNKKFLFINGRKIYINKNAKTKNKNGVGAVSSGNYTGFGALHAKCLPTPPNKSSFPMKLHHGGCNVNYLTPEDAIIGGALPIDWMNKDFGEEKREKNLGLYEGIQSNQKEQEIEQDVKQELEQDVKQEETGDNLNVIISDFRQVDNIGLTTSLRATTTNIYGCLTKLSTEEWEGNMYSDVDIKSNPEYIGLLKIFKENSIWKMNFYQKNTVIAVGGGKTPGPTYDTSHIIVSVGQPTSEDSPVGLSWQIEQYRYNEAGHYYSILPSPITVVMTQTGEYFIPVLNYSFVNIHLFQQSVATTPSQIYNLTGSLTGCLEYIEQSLPESLDKKWEGYNNTDTGNNLKITIEYNSISKLWTMVIVEMFYSGATAQHNYIQESFTSDYVASSLFPTDIVWNKILSTSLNGTSTNTVSTLESYITPSKSC